MPLIQLTAGRFHYQQTGEGPDVVLVHAFTSNLSIWMLTGIIDKLAQQFRVTCYDLRGHGMSGVTPGGYTSADMAEDFRELSTALDLGPAYLVGHSFGGVVALHAAVQYPSLVAGVILSDSYFPGLRHLEPDMGQAEVWKDLRATLLEIGTDIGPRVDFGLLFREVASWTPTQLDQLKQQLGPPGVRWLSQLSQLAPTSAGDEMFQVAGLTAERICSIQQPVFALYDEFSPFEETRNFLQQNLRDCTIDTVAGAKHLAPVQNSAQFVRLVHQYLKQMVEGRRHASGR